MKVSGISGQVMRFILDEQYYQIPRISESGVIIQLIELEGSIRLMIEVEENTTSNDIREAIPLALLWRDKLSEWQGPLRGGSNGLLEKLYYRNKSGETYSDLSKQINARIEEYLQEFARYLSEYNEKKSEFQTMYDFHMWQSEANRYSIEHAKELLKAMRLKDAEIEDLLREGLENIQAGKRAFELDYPISREKLITTLRSWEKNNKHRILKEGNLRDKRRRRRESTSADEE